MALGGVDIGKHIAADAAKAIGITNLFSKPADKLIAIGKMILAAAVLLIKFDSKLINKPIIKVKPRTLKLPKEILPTSQAAKPVSETATPNDKPPASSSKISHGRLLISFLSIIPVVVNAVIGISAMAVAGIL